MISASKRASDLSLVQNASRSRRVSGRTQREVSIDVPSDSERGQSSEKGALKKEKEKRCDFSGRSGEQGRKKKKNSTSSLSRSPSLLSLLFSLSFSSHFAFSHRKKKMYKQSLGSRKHTIKDGRKKETQPSPGRRAGHQHPHGGSSQSLPSRLTILRAQEQRGEGAAGQASGVSCIAFCFFGSGGEGEGEKRVPPPPLRKLLPGPGGVDMTASSCPVVKFREPSKAETLCASYDVRATIDGNVTTG